MPIESLTQHRLNDRLSTHVEVPSRPIELGEHGRCEVDIYSLNRCHHAPPVGKEARYIFAFICAARIVAADSGNALLRLLLRNEVLAFALIVFTYLEN